MTSNGQASGANGVGADGVADGVVDGFVPVARWWYLVIDGPLFVALVAALSPRAYERWAKGSPLPIPPRQAMQALAVASVVAHIVETTLAHRWAADPRTVRSRRRWVRQTAIVGFPSLQALRKITSAT